MPQGSVVGPILFTSYCSTITSVIDEGSEIELGAFADDHNLRKMFILALPDNEKEALKVMEMSLDNIIKWMNMNHLKINPTKTEFMYIACKWQIRKCLKTQLELVQTGLKGWPKLSYWCLVR